LVASGIKITINCPLYLEVRVLNSIGIAMFNNLLSDGGYMGNPAIFPLIYSCDSRDVVIVHINPIERPEVPKTAGEILNRINEISFNSSLLLGLLCDQAVRGGEDYGQDHKAHVEADDVMQAMS
jgi:predicted acylesterase/phospholipase RssA